MSQALHESVLLKEAIDALSVKASGVYVDGTFGRGGHSSKILESLAEEGCLVAFDKDLQAVEYYREHYEQDARLTLVHASFAEMAEVLADKGLLGKVDGLLLDLGVSSPQLDEAERGFSFLRNGPLDMRMDATAGMTAAQWLAEADQDEIKYVLKVYGEERFAGLLAKRIVERREEKPFETTLDLAEFIAEVAPKTEKNKHPATRSFQAIRIHINRELDDLKLLLQSAVDILSEGGRLVVISFHSLEDRIVKQFMKEQDRGPQLPRNIPVQSIERGPHLKIVSKPVKAGKEEVSQSVRSRSAVMRIAEKVAA
jgi:16S rRNA (cytosine1402-N4)-methyltransferase